MAQHRVASFIYCVLSGSISPICKLEWVKGGRETGFDAVEDLFLDQGETEDSGEDGCELVGTRSQHLTWCFVWTHSLPGIDCLEHPPHVMLLYGECRKLMGTGLLWMTVAVVTRSGQRNCSVPLSVTYS